MDPAVPPPETRTLERLSPPPRLVPLEIKISELTGGMLSGLGWFFLGFGLIFVWIFVLKADLSSWRYSGELSRAPARVEGCRRTGFSESSGRRGPSSYIYANDFSFTRDDRVHRGRSYAHACLEAGEAAVEFPKGRPELARLQGMRRAPFSPAVLFILIFPGIGLIFVLSSVRTGLRDIGLLERGLMARAKAASSKPTNLRVNNQVVWEVTMSFRDRSGAERRMTARTRDPLKLERDGVHSVFYDPDDPSEAIAVDALPQPLFSDASGRLTTDGWRRARLGLTPPCIALAAQLLYWAAALLRSR